MVQGSKKPGFLKKNQPSGGFWVLLGFLDKQEKIGKIIQKLSNLNSVVTVIETGTETAVFLPNRTEPKPRFYASVLTVRFRNGTALVP